MPRIYLPPPMAYSPELPVDNYEHESFYDADVIGLPSEDWNGTEAFNEQLNDPSVSYFAQAEDVLYEDQSCKSYSPAVCQSFLAYMRQDDQGSTYLPGSKIQGYVPSQGSYVYPSDKNNLSSDYDTLYGDADSPTPRKPRTRTVRHQNAPFNMQSLVPVNGQSKPINRESFISVFSLLELLHICTKIAPKATFQTALDLRQPTRSYRKPSASDVLTEQGRGTLIGTQNSNSLRLRPVSDLRKHISTCHSEPYDELNACSRSIRWNIQVWRIQCNSVKML